MRFVRWMACFAVLSMGSIGCSAGAGPTSLPPTGPTMAVPTAPPTLAAIPSASVAPAQTQKSLYDEQADARADIAAALTASKADGKRVLLDFGADWCIDCHVLAAYLDSDAGRRLVEPAFHIVSIDVGYWDHNVDVAAEYGSPIENGIPAVVVLEPDGSVVGSSADGSLATASGMTQEQVLTYLRRWAP